MQSCHLLPWLAAERRLNRPEQIEAHVTVGTFGHGIGDNGTELGELQDRGDTRTGQHLLRLGAKALKVCD